MDQEHYKFHRYNGNLTLTSLNACEHACFWLFGEIFHSILVRGMLGICCLASFRLFRHGVCKKFGPTVANFLMIITMTQFHLIFYMSRPLPNIFALVLGKDENLSLNSYLDLTSLRPIKS